MNDITVARFGKRLTLSKAANCLVTSFHWSLDAHQPVRLCQPIDNAKLGTYMIRVTDLHDTPSNRQTHHVKCLFCSLCPCHNNLKTSDEQATSQQRRNNVVLTQRRWQFSKTSFLVRTHRFETERCLPDSSGFLLDDRSKKYQDAVKTPIKACDLVQILAIRITKQEQGQRRLRLSMKDAVEIRSHFPKSFMLKCNQDSDCYRQEKPQSR